MHVTGGHLRNPFISHKASVLEAIAMYTCKLVTYTYIAPEPPLFALLSVVITLQQIHASGPTLVGPM